MRLRILALFALVVSAFFLTPNPALAVVQHNDWLGAGADAGYSYLAPTSIPVNLVSNLEPLAKTTNIPFVISGKRLYTAEDNKNLVAVDLENKTVKWKFTIEGQDPRFMGLVADGNMIYALTADRLYALEDSGDTPVVKWSRLTKLTRLTHYQSTIMYWENGYNNSNKIVARDAASGEVKWEFLMSEYIRVSGQITSGGGRVYFVYNDTSVSSTIAASMYSLNLETGKVEWTSPLGHSGQYSSWTPMYKDGKVFLDRYAIDNSITAFDAASGKSFWKYDITNIVGNHDPSLSSNDDSVFAVDSDGYLMAINIETGAQRWKLKYSDQPGERPSLIKPTSDKIFISYGKKIKVIDARTGAFLRDIWPNQGANPPTYSLKAIAAGMLFISDGNYIYTLVPSDPASDNTKPECYIDVVGPQRFSAKQSFQKVLISTHFSEEVRGVLLVFGQDGKVVQRKDLGWFHNRWNDIYWDGKDSEGKPLPDGMYYFGFEMEDLSGNKGYYENQNKTVTLAVVYGTTLKNANVRKGPGTQYEIVTVVPAGQNINIKGESGNWYQIEYQVGYTKIEGYISKSLVIDSLGNDIPVAEPRDLNRGCRGDDVAQLQRNLNELGFYTGKPDGIFGSKTEQAILALQKENGVTANGIVNSQTRQTLTVFQPRVLYKGLTGSDVARLQQRLNELGYNCGTADGKFGSRSYQAVATFQMNKNMKIDGVVGKLARQALAIY